MLFLLFLILSDKKHIVMSKYTNLAKDYTSRQELQSTVSTSISRTQDDRYDTYIEKSSVIINKILSEMER